MSLKNFLGFVVLCFTSFLFGQEQDTVRGVKVTKESAYFKGQVAALERGILENFFQIDVNYKFQIASADIKGSDNKRIKLNWTAAIEACKNYSEKDIPRGKFFLPDLKVLKNIYSKTKEDSNLASSFPKYVENNDPSYYAYWSSSESKSDATAVFFAGEGNDFEYNKDSDKLYVRCVAYKNENAINVFYVEQVYKFAVEQKDSKTVKTAVNWDTAKKFCENTPLGFMEKNWILPDKIAFDSILTAYLESLKTEDKILANNFVDKGFYWTSSVSEDGSKAWVQPMCEKTQCPPDLKNLNDSSSLVCCIRPI